MFENFDFWCEYHMLDITKLDEGFFKINGDDKLWWVLPNREKVFDANKNFILTPDEYVILDANKDALNIVFIFGGSWYFCPIKCVVDENNEEAYQANLIDFMYIGKCKIQNRLNKCLGIHTQYEILNSALNFKTAIKKAKFLGINHIGLCDKNTLAATLSFQTECKKNGVNFSIGTSINVVSNYNENSTTQEKYIVKLFMCDEEGWFNMLAINNTANSIYDGFVTEEYLLSHSNGLVCIFDYSEGVLKDLRDDKKYKNIIKKYKSSFKEVYYQFSSVMYVSNQYDSSCLEGFKHYLKNYVNELGYIYIDDVYFLEKYQSDCKLAVNEIAKTPQQYSENQYMKHYEEVCAEIQNLFETNDKFEQFVSIGYDNLNHVCEITNCEINSQGAKLPKYEIDGIELDEHESIDMLRMLCEQGFEEKILPIVKNDGELKSYRQRLEREFKIITEAGFADYFLIQWDAINSVIENGHMIGNGRGSVAGALMAMILGITAVTVDPIKNELLFERFLNEARVQPDIKIVVTFDNGDKFEFKENEIVETKNGAKKAKELVGGDCVISL